MLKRSDLMPIAIGVVAVPAVFFATAQIARPLLHPAPAVTHPATPTPTVTEKITVWRHPRYHYTPPPQPSPSQAVVASPPPRPSKSHRVQPSVTATFPPTPPATTAPPATPPPTTPPATFPPTTPPVTVAVPPPTG